MYCGWYRSVPLSTVRAEGVCAGPAADQREEPPRAEERPRPADAAADHPRPGARRGEWIH